MLSSQVDKACQHHVSTAFAPIEAPTLTQHVDKRTRGVDTGGGLQTGSLPNPLQGNERGRAVGEVRADIGGCSEAGYPRARYGERAVCPGTLGTEC